MAKRRKLETPSADDLDRFEAEFRRETSTRPAPMVPPIAQVAAETAGALDPRDEADRAAAARDQADAERLRAASEDGRLILEVPLDQIEPDSLVRDRTVMDEDELQELANSIAAHGLRLPVEIYDLARPVPGGARYGLLSGYRRYLAVQRLCAMMGGEKFTTIRALIRDPGAMGGSFVAMVEENEIRASLSPYERGRIAVIAAQNGAFVNTEAAVDALFAAASKAKRSKIRSFAQVFEELGDLLRHPETLSEKQGLKLATALRGGGERRLRRALELADPGGFDEEWAVLEAAMEDLTPAEADPRRGGRPRARPAPLPAPEWEDGRPVKLSTGWILTREIDARGPLIRIEGRAISADVMRDVMDSIRRALEVK